MFKTVSATNNEIFALNHNHFIILSLTLFTVLFIYAVPIFWDEIYIALQRKFIVPQLEKKFGFRGRREKIKSDKSDHEYEIFSIETIEPGSLFSQAGFKPGDAPRFYGCRFFVNGKTNEAMFYTQLNSIRDENISVFTVTNIDGFRKYVKTDGYFDLRERKVFLTTDFPECSNLQ